jgi:hypothetical protein
VDRQAKRSAKVILASLPVIAVLLLLPASSIIDNPTKGPTERESTREGEAADDSSADRRSQLEPPTGQPLRPNPTKNHPGESRERRDNSTNPNEAREQQGVDANSEKARPPAESGTSEPNEQEPDGSSPFSRKDPVPAGISAQLDYFQGGGNVCGDQVDDFSIAPIHSPDQRYMTAPDVYAICIEGYDADKDISVVVRGPSGTVVETRVITAADLIESNSFPFRRLHTDPLGTYTFTATQGSAVATTALELRAASSPQFMGYNDDAQGRPDFGLGLVGQPGDEFRIALGGYSPNSTVHMRIYGNPHGDGQGPTVVDYLTSVPFVVDSRGGGILTIRSAPSDAEGCYVLHNELVTRLMYPAPEAPEAPAILWNVSICIFHNIID